MWELIQTLVYIVLALMLLTTFLKPAQRQRAREALGAFWHAIEPYAYRIVTGMGVPDDQTVEPRRDLHRPVDDDFLLPAAENDALHGGVAVEKAPDFTPATAEEIRALTGALRHNLTSADKTKSGAIKAGWGLTRSGSDPRYARASELYDLATKAPEPAQEFPTLAAARKEAEQPTQRRSKTRTT